MAIGACQNNNLTVPGLTASHAAPITAARHSRAFSNIENSFFGTPEKFSKN
jgi:hypothetical protein